MQIDLQNKYNIRHQEQFYILIKIILKIQQMQ